MSDSMPCNKKLRKDGQPPQIRGEPPQHLEDVNHKRAALSKYWRDVCLVDRELAVKREAEHFFRGEWLLSRHRIRIELSANTTSMVAKEVDTYLI